MNTKQVRIAELAKANPGMAFTSLAHLMDEEELRQCHRELQGNKATGIDQVTKVAYQENVADNLSHLVMRLKQKSYRPLPVRRVYIDKPGSTKKRPLGIPAYEDKIVQRGLAKILNAIYEQDFLDCSFGFRPNRSCHDALKVLNVSIEKRYTNYIVDVDIKGFFDHVDHQWMMRFLNHRINDPSLLRLIARFLKAGYMEKGTWYASEQGTPQGGLISPILANIYLHYVIDLWFMKVVKKQCQGQAYLVRYADDFVCCFQYKQEAEQFYSELKQRIGKFNLTLAEEKARIIPFGRFAWENARRIENRKPKTFDFLGFTHYCGWSKSGHFRVKRKSSRKKVCAKLKAHGQWLKAHRTKEIDSIMDRIKRSLIGYYNYYCVTDNIPSVNAFRLQVIRLLYKWLNRRSQKRSYTWEKFNQFLKRCPLPQPRIKVNIYQLRPELSYIL
ncbi:group II intron reverse transcriptase/maturase [Sporolactobacillus sp. STSJ-5]|uniref:group II intron reverse transcriptase/maturase n=1 Tax=Sporolactobacillus sp. STSJ-5 TaxID=2965076 RepID=UPI002107A51F|nr:group II intron reverse transcriptase/maturase [Sporolactobacillus sp. STSJ-5]MCQ2011664.1 group II intron reverse transcriptase/maturase [Sporolactobacillus sp. STSJ-5]